MRAGILVFGLVAVSAAYAGDAFVAARPPKAGLWENTIATKALGPSEETAAAAGTALSIAGMPYITNSRAEPEPALVIEQVCWSEAELERASWKSDTETALRAIVPDAPCENDEKSPGNVVLYCRLDAEHGTRHSYGQRTIDNNTFAADEGFELVNVKDPNTSLMAWEMSLIGRWIGPDCTAKK